MASGKGSKGLVLGLHGSFEFALLLFDGFMPRLSVVLGAATVLAFLAAIASTWFRAPWNPGDREWDLQQGGFDRGRHVSTRRQG